jgi:hypothetical protein
MQSARVAGIAAAAVTVLLAGCGSSSSSKSTTKTTTTSGTLSKTALITTGNAICKVHADVVSAGAAKLLAGGKLPTPSAFGKFANDTVIPQYSEQVTQLTALKPPSSIATEYGTWMTASRTTLSAIKKNPVLIQSSKTFVAVNKDGDVLGFSADCHVGPSR